MVKKKNIFKSVEYEQLKRNLSSKIEYVESQMIGELTDDVDWQVTQKGVMPKIVSKIESKIKTMLTVIKDSCEMLLLIHEKEGLTGFIEGKILILRNKLTEIQEFSDNNPVAKIQHRRLTYETGGSSAKKKKKTRKNTIEVGLGVGESEEPEAESTTKTRVMSFLVATREQQIEDWSRMDRVILITLPLLEELEGLKAAEAFKGGAAVPPSFRLLGLV